MPNLVTLGASRTRIGVGRLPTPVDHITVAETILKGAPGDTFQLAATLFDAEGNVITGRVVSWQSADPTIATVSSTGLVTAMTNGASTITVTSEGKSATASITLNELAALQAKVPGGDARLLGVFSAGDPNIAIVSGSATAIDDLRGPVGYWPSFLPAAAAGVQVIGTDLLTRVLVSTDGHAMQTALQNYTGARTLFWIGKPKVGSATSDAGDFVFPIGIENTDGSQGMKFEMKPNNAVPVHDPAHLGATFYPPGAEAGGTQRLQSVKHRVMGLTRSADGTTTALELNPRGPSEAPTSAPPGAITATSWRLTLGAHANAAFVFGSETRAIYLLSGVADQNDIEAVIDVVQSYHPTCVTGAPSVLLFEGDSEAAGAIQADNFIKTWTTIVSEDPALAAWDDYNIATSGANSGTLASRLNSQLLPILTADQTRQFITIQCGTNDLRLGNSADTVLANLFAETASILSAHPAAVIWIAEVLPATAVGFGSVVSQATLDAAIADFNTKLNAQAAGQGCRVMQFTLDAPFNSPTGWQNATYSLDGLHWKLAGLLILAARALATYLAALL